MVVAAFVLGALSGCGEKRTVGDAGNTGPVEVGVVTINPQPFALTRELLGRTSAYRVAEVRARVSGIVLKRHFEEGSEVREGQLLYQIDPAPYQAALNGAKAALARAEASAASAKLQADRYRELVNVRAVSQQDYDDAHTQQLTSDADVVAARAAVQTAQIDLDYTRVLAPISGRVGRSAVTEGAYVRQSDATLLTTIQQIDQLYVDVTQSSSELLRLKQDLKAGLLTHADDGAASVTLILDGDQIYGENGWLQFADVTVDASTSSVLLRVLVPNPNRELLPGLFVRARLQEGVNPAALLVPQQGITRNRHGAATALVVGAENKVEQRVLKADRAIGSLWLVTSGLKAGEQVIVQNLQKIRVGVPVKPVPATNLGTPGDATATPERKP
ncbi:efflux transporter periplasmic adaptor subunit [Termitidicoccus mucosus]|uniref:Efflux transporter periplasmic adaptor subunit n=1 Tax=Termitidicoccus mucosus TaxID=1184151 RepID=A0A178IIG5_9BACT|nr:efflux transporter periplasmic adaptor subunit [Opitutaceae bacterium TSB47]